MPEPFTPSPSFAAKASRFTPGQWVLAPMVLRQSLHWVGVLVLARMLAPADFGLMSMAMTVVLLFVLVQDLGTGAAVVRDRAGDHSFLSSVYWLNVAVSAALCALGVFGASWAAALYGEPRVIPVLQALSLIFPLRGISVVHSALLRRDMAFRAVGIVDIASALASVGVALGAALYGAGVWSLVFQGLTDAFVAALLLRWMSDWRPAMTVSAEAVRRSGGFGLKLVGADLAEYASRNIDYILVGRCLGSAALGIYGLAFSIILFPVTRIATLLGRVMYPWLCRQQDDDAAFGEAYVRAVGYVALITFPMMCGLEAVVNPFVRLALPREWWMLADLLALLAPVGMLKSVIAATNAVFQARGRTGSLLLCRLFALCGFAAAVLIGMRYGLLYVAGAYLVAHLAVAVPFVLWPLHLARVRLPDFVQALAPSFFASTIMLFALKALDWSALQDWSDAGRVAMLIPAGVAVYAAATWWLNRAAVRSLWRLFCERPANDFDSSVASE